MSLTRIIHLESVITFNPMWCRYSEVIVATLILVITGCFAVQMILSKPSPEPLFYGFVPQTSLVTNKEQLYIAIGILGATGKRRSY